MVLVIGVLSSIGGSIGSQVMAITRLRAAAERMCADIKAQREQSLARGSILPLGTTIGVHFFTNRFEIERTPAAQPGFSYVPFGLVRNRGGFIDKPTPPTGPPLVGTTYAPLIVNLPPGITVQTGNPTGAPAVAMAVRAGSMSFVMGNLDGPSVGPFRVIELSDPAITGVFRITMSGQPPNFCGNPILTFETP